MIEKVDPKFVRMFIKKDPVRPHINADVRMAPGRDMFHIDEQAFVCVAYLDKVPKNEEELLSFHVGDIVVAYTVWSRKRGAGKEIITKLMEHVQKNTELKRMVTLSPLTPMATHFHIRNGAKLIKHNPDTQNFEYKL